MSVNNKKDAEILITCWPDNIKNESNKVNSAAKTVIIQNVLKWQKNEWDYHKINCQQRRSILRHFRYVSYCYHTDSCLQPVFLLANSCPSANSSLSPLCPRELQPSSGSSACTNLQKLLLALTISKELGDKFFKCLFCTVHLFLGSWRLLCRAKWSDRAKQRSQTLHLNGLEPVCFRIWRVSSSERANRHWQFWKWHR